MAAIGRARRKRPEKPVVVELSLPQREGTDSEAGDGFRAGVLTTVCRSTALSDFQRVSPAMPHLGIFAVEPDKRARELFHFMSGEASHIYRPFRVEWFGMALLVPSSYYLCLANAALFMDQHVTHRTRLDYTDSIESTKYYSKCLKQVTKQLACQAQSVSEGIVTTVLGFVCHSFATGKWDQCEMHMQGLERIIRLRGGFQGLGDFSPLFASWFDVTNSAIQDIPPRFLHPLRICDGPTMLEELPSAMIPLLAELENISFDLTRLTEGLSTVARLSSYVNKHSQQLQFWEAGLNSTKLVGPAAHCILSIPRLDLPRHLDDDESSSVLLLQEILRVALLILLATLKKAFSLVADELMLYLERFSCLIPLMVGLSCFPELRLWAYIVDACAREEPIPQIQISEIRHAMSVLQTQTSESIQQRKLSGFMPC